MGIYDRDYMREHRPDPWSGRKALIALVVINVLCFILLQENGAVYNLLALEVGSGFSIATIWQIFTAGFLHHGFGHIFFNMWGLYIFGSLVAPHLNGTKFVILYFSGVVIGNLLFLLYTPLATTPTQLVGASGAVCAVMAAAATLEPERRFSIIFLPFFPLKTTTLVICYTLLDLIFFLINPFSPIAHLAHMGGFFGGYIAMRIFFGKNLPWDPLRKLFYHNPHIKKTCNESNPGNTNGSSNRVSQRELDALLDKLSTSGINSLSDYELERLRIARRQMRGEKD